MPSKRSHAFSAIAIAAIASADAFSFDGTTSDLAQQFRQLSVSASSPLSKLAIDRRVLPGAITQRLANTSLSFEDLSPYLQRALLWDSGYVLEKGTGDLVSISVPSGSGWTMADIVVSASDYAGAGCTFDIKCVTISPAIKRAGQCTGTQLANMRRCAASSVKTEFESSTWATGGTATFLPAPNVVRHSTGDTNYPSIHAIHTLDAAEFGAGTCPSTAASSGMIIPCVPLAASRAKWSQPQPSDAVMAWVAQEAAAVRATKNGTVAFPSSKPTRTIDDRGDVADAMTSRRTRSSDQTATPSNSGFNPLNLIPIFVALVILTLIGMYVINVRSKRTKPSDGNVYHALE